jgi:hypothetical protein
MSATMCRLVAMKDHAVQIEAVNVGDRYIVFAGGLQIPIVAFLDEDYEETDDLDEAYYYEFGTDAFGYGTHRFDYNEGVTEWEQ